MGVRKAFSASIAPVNLPRVLGARNLRLPIPVTVGAKRVSVWQVEGINSQFNNLTTSPLLSDFHLLFSSSIETGVRIEGSRETIIWDTLKEPTTTEVDFYFQPLSAFLARLSIPFWDVSLPVVIDVEASNDLFVKLLAGGAKGKKYVKDEWKNAFKKVTRRPTKKQILEQRIKTIKIRLGDEETDDEDAQNEEPQFNKAPSFFDLIKPLLYPPITIASGEYGIFLPPGKKPYEYQRRGIDKLISNRAFLLADEMGTGKTVMATIAIRILLRKGEARRVLVLCPVSVLRVWEEHLQDWSLGEMTVVLVRGPRAQRRIIWGLDFHVFVTSYDVFSRDVQSGVIPEDKLRFDLIVLDEAQYIKNRKSARFRSLQRVSANWRWAMTGTPLENNVEDVKAIFEFLLPGLIHPEETSPFVIKQYIQPYMLRRLKKDVLSELPPKQRQWRWLEMSEKQRQQYEKVRKQGIAELVELNKEGKVTKIHVFTLLHKLKKICNFPSGSLSSPKADEVVNIVEEVVSSGEKVIIFSQYIEEGIAKLAEILDGYGVVQLTGKMTATQRRIAIDSFKSDPNVAIFLISLKAGGTGLTLTEASYVVHFDHWWNPAVMTQAEDRVHRAGQKRAVMIYELGMENSIERRIYEVLQEKKVLAQQVIDDLAEGVDLSALDITLDEWLHKVLQISPDDREKGSDNSALVPKHNVQIQDGFSVSWNADKLEEIRNKLYEMDPLQFERLVAEVFTRFGYSEVLHQGRPSDGGVDVLARSYDEEGVHHAIVQCKRYSQNVGVRVARNLAGVLSQQRGDYKGYIVTSSDFTSQCRQFVAKSGGKITLINGLELARYILQYGLDNLL